MTVQNGSVFAINITTNSSAEELTLQKLQDGFDGMQKDMDDMFLVICAIFTSFMQVGFACLEAGCVNSKNVTNIILKNVLDSFICAIFYWLFGYTLAYGDGNAFIGYHGWGTSQLTPDKYSFWVFEFMFASTASTILSGSVAERCTFVTYMSYSSTISGFFYPIGSRWVWYKIGWLNVRGYKDLAGCGAVHAFGGTCAFVAAAMMGPRIGRFQDGKPVDKPGHSMSLVGLGGLLLVSGFLGFNAGSIGHIHGQGFLMGKIVQNTMLGGGAAAILMMTLCRLGVVNTSKYPFMITVNATLVGMVSVCGAVNEYDSGMAVLVGAGGCLSFLFVRYIVLQLKVDDPLDAVPLHFGGGFFGVLAIPFCTPDGLLYGVNENSALGLINNLMGGVIIVLWAIICSLVLFGTLMAVGYLRVSEEEEIQGLDVTKHQEPAYPIEGWAIDYPVQSQVNPGLRKNGSYTLNRSDDGGLVMVGPNLERLATVSYIK